MKCHVCNDQPGFITWNFNGKIKLGPHHTVLVCQDCDLSIQNQGFLILEELGVPEPHILKMGMPLDYNTIKVGLMLKIPNITGGKHGRRSTVRSSRTKKL